MLKVPQGGLLLHSGIYADKLTTAALDFFSKVTDPKAALLFSYGWLAGGVCPLHEMLCLGLTRFMLSAGDKHHHVLRRTHSAGWDVRRLPRITCNDQRRLKPILHIARWERSVVA